MQALLTPAPGACLLLDLAPGESFLAEKGAFLYSTGPYSFQHRTEMGSARHWAAKLLAGKSLTYALYTAQAPLRMAFAPKSPGAEIVCLDVSAERPLLLEPSLHLGRSPGLGLHFASQNWKTALNDGVKVRTEGSGLLCFFGHGQVRSLELDGTAPLVIDERALVAYESSLAVRNRAGSAKEVLVSGEGILLSVEGSGKIWLQTREKMANGGGGGLIEGIFGLFK